MDPSAGTAPPALMMAGQKGNIMDVREIKVSDQLHECLVALISDGAYPADLLSVDEVRWLKNEFGDQLVKHGRFLWLEV